jgi:chromosomal replication initiation ATPase DnaA
MAEALFLGPLSIWRASHPQIVIPMSELVTPATTTRAIKRRIAFEYGVTVEEIDGPSRVRRILIPRLLVYEAFRQLGFSYPQIGQRVGGRDHSSIMSGLKTLAKYRAQNLIPEGK